MRRGKQAGRPNEGGCGLPGSQRSVVQVKVKGETVSFGYIDKELSADCFYFVRVKQVDESRRGSGHIRPAKGRGRVRYGLTTRIDKRSSLLVVPWTRGHPFMSAGVSLGESQDQSLPSILSITQLVIAPVLPVLGLFPEPRSSSTMICMSGCWI